MGRFYAESVFGKINKQNRPAKKMRLVHRWVIFTIFLIFFIFNRSWFSLKNWGWHQDTLTPKLKVKLSETEREMVKQRKLKREELFELDKSSEEKFKLKGLLKLYDWLENSNSVQVDLYLYL